MTQPSTLRVGVSIYIRKGYQSLWENGIFQNCLFMVMLLLKAPDVSEVYLVAGGGDGDLTDAAQFLTDSPVPIIPMDQAIDRLDVMIEMSSLLSKDWVTAFKDKGGKVVTMRVGNDYVIDIERMIFDKPAGFLVTGVPYDEIWTLPEYERSCQAYYASALRAPVRLMPHLWAPDVIVRASGQLPATQSFGYQPGRSRWRAGIFEPNICMVKTCQIPMLVADCAHRLNPNVLEKLWVYNALELKNHAVFVQFAMSLNLVKHGLGSFEGRFPVFELLARDVDVVVCHHWENGQNYLYYEALFGGYPLVHNSTFLDGCGYYYPEFDCEKGGQVLLEAFAHHDKELASYRQRVTAYLQRLHPENPANVKAHNDALIGLYQ